ncbi:hypothetical protein D3C75_742410 [compost metagenome]
MITEDKIDSISEGNYVAQSYAEADRRLKEGINPCHRHIFAVYIIRNVGKTFLIKSFLHICTDHADSGYRFQHLVVHVTEGILCQAVAVVDSLAVENHRNRDQRKRQNRRKRQLPADQKPHCQQYY